MAEDVLFFRKMIIFAVAYGGLAQLARALAWHARGHRFDPDILHYIAIVFSVILLIMDLIG